MGKIANRMAALGNHQRQREQMDLILHGWVPFDTGAAWHEEHGYLGKDGMGKPNRWSASALSQPLRSSLCEWDDLTTLRVHWIYKQLVKEGLL